MSASVLCFVFESNHSQYFLFVNSFRLRLVGLGLGLAQCFRVSVGFSVEIVFAKETVSWWPLIGQHTLRYGL